MNQIESENKPIKPIKRYRWLVRGVVGCLSLIVLLCGSWLWANHRGDQKLQALVDEIHADGGAILFTDLKKPFLANEDNKAFYLRQAFESQWPRMPGTQLSLLETDWYNSDDQIDEYGDLIPDPVVDDALYLKQCQSMLDLIQKATDAKSLDWDRNYVQGKILSSDYPESSEIRKVSNLLEDLANRYLNAGDLNRALICVDYILNLSQMTVGELDGFLIDYFVGVSIQAQAIELLEKIVSEDLNEVDRDVLSSIRVELLDETRLDQSLKYAIEMERVMGWDVFESIKQNYQNYVNVNGYGGSSRLSSLWFFVSRPFLKYDQLFYGKQYAFLLRGISSGGDTYWGFVESFEEAGGVWGNDLDELVESDNLKYRISSVLHIAIEGGLKSHFRIKTSRRFAAIAIAIKLYEIDTGEIPQSLVDLQPEYLSVIPIDPLDPEGRQLRYLPNGASLYRQPYFATKGHSSDQILTELPNHDDLIDIPGPPVLYSIGVSGFDRGCPIAVEEDGKVLSQAIYSNRYKFNWFALGKWPEIEPTKEYLQYLEEFEMENVFP